MFRAQMEMYFYTSGDKLLQKQGKSLKLPDCLK